MFIERRTLRQLDPRTRGLIKSILNVDDTELILRAKRGDEEVFFLFTTWPWTGDLVVRMFVYVNNMYKSNAVISRPILTLPLDVVEMCLVRYQGRLDYWLACNLPSNQFSYFYN